MLIQYNNIKTGQINKNIHCIESLDWNLYHHQNAHYMVTTLNDNVLDLLNCLALIKSRRVRHTPKHWFNNEIQQAMNERKAAYDC